MTDTAFDLRHHRPADALVDVVPLTALDELADELRPITARTVNLLVDSRPGWSVVYGLDLEGGKLNAWRRAARDENLDQVDEDLWNRTILAAHCREIRRHGAKVTDETGRTLTFWSESLWRLLGVPAGAPSGATEAVGRFYGGDFAVAGAVTTVLDEAGFGRAAKKAPDPTGGSSSD